MEKKKRGRPRTFEREGTIKLAMENYWQEGLYSQSVNEVCRRLNLSKPLLYREFNGEDGLLDAVLEHYVEVVLTPQTAILNSEQSFVETIEVVIEFMTSPSDAPKGCLLVKMRDALERLGPLAKTRVDSVVREIRKAYSEWFIRAKKRGEVRSDIEPELAGQYIDTQVMTVLRQVAADENSDEVRAQARLAFDALLSHPTTS